MHRHIAPAFCSPATAFPASHHRHWLSRLAGAVIFSFVLAAGSASALSDCTILGLNNYPQGKANKLYLYFPPSDDTSFPEFGVRGLQTRPARKFDTAALTSYNGTASELQDGVVDVVSDDYCEFNVEVIATAAMPATTYARRNTVAVGTDSAKQDGADAFGWSQEEDTNDKEAVDHARVYAGTYEVSTAVSGELSGPKSTVARWANAIGGTVAHEAAHNYGLSHDVTTRPGEDDARHHLMGPGSYYTDKDRADRRRHFSDKDFEILAELLGLSVQTMFNWTFVNPNAETATALELDFISVQSSPMLGPVYTGSQTPWIDPALTVIGPYNYRGSSTVYTRYRLTWSSGHGWSGGPAGEVPGGVPFNLGASLVAVDPSTPDPIIIIAAKLVGATGQPLALQPRVAGFDTTALALPSGQLAVEVASVDKPPLFLENTEILFLPRPASIDAILPRNPVLFDAFYRHVSPWKIRRASASRSPLDVDRPTAIVVARLRERRHVLEIVDARMCERSDTRSGRRDTQRCKTGVHVSLFPATSIVVRGTLVDPKAKQWDPGLGKYVVRPLRTYVSYQFAGRRIDLDRNGVDDAVDIALHPERDRNRDGVIDHVDIRQ